MSRSCSCHRACRHRVPTGTDRLLPPARLLPLEPHIPTLIDSADAFDADTLNMDPECEVHGSRAVSNAVCSCSGARYSAVEFVQALGLDVRAVMRRPDPIVSSVVSDETRARQRASARRRWDREKRTEAPVES